LSVPPIGDMMERRPQNPADTAEAAIREKIDALYREESRRVLATLIRLLGDFDRAE
jgi:hypothetical protein